MTEYYVINTNTKVITRHNEMPYDEIKDSDNIIIHRNEWQSFVWDHNKHFWWEVPKID